MPEWKNRVVLDRGMYMRQNTTTKNWHLFDKNGKQLGDGKTIRETEDIYNKLLKEGKE